MSLCHDHVASCQDAMSVKIMWSLFQASVTVSLSSSCEIHVKNKINIFVFEFQAKLTKEESPQPPKT